MKANAIIIVMITRIAGEALRINLNMCCPYHYWLTYFLMLELYQYPQFW